MELYVRVYLCLCACVFVSLCVCVYNMDTVARKSLIKKGIKDVKKSRPPVRNMRSMIKVEEQHV